MKNKTKLSTRQIVTLLKKSRGRDLELLIAHSIGQPKEFVFFHPEYRLTFFEYLKLRYCIYLRQKNYPIAYITKRKEFYGLDFYVNKHVLVPRPETEMVVDEIICHCEGVRTTEAISSLSLRGVATTKQTRLPVIERNENDILLIDVGTGSGCIPISLIKTLEPNNNITIIATDISRSALRVAKINAKKHNVKINFLYGNLLEPIFNEFNNGTTRLPTPGTGGQVEQWNNVIITANLPYLTARQFQNEPSIQHEPKKALIADNADGLSLYEELLKQISKLIAYSLPLIAYLEIDPSQSKSITQLIKQRLPLANVEIKKDLAGLDRLVCLTIEQSSH